MQLESNEQWTCMENKHTIGVFMFNIKVTHENSGHLKLSNADNGHFTSKYPLSGKLVNTSRTIHSNIDLLFYQLLACTSANSVTLF